MQGLRLTTCTAGWHHNRWGCVRHHGAGRQTRLVVPWVSVPGVSTTRLRCTAGKPSRAHRTTSKAGRQAGSATWLRCSSYGTVQGATHHITLRSMSHQRQACRPPTAALLLAQLALQPQHLLSCLHAQRLAQQVVVAVAEGALQEGCELSIWSPAGGSSSGCGGQGVRLVGGLV